jgi:peptide/nickel transport system substrate-binding protein
MEGKLSEKTGIAYKWEMTPDGKTWTFYLRDGIMFHNGDKLTAEDVKFQLDRIFDPATSSTQVSALRKIIDKVKVAAPNKVVVHLKKPNIFLPEILSEVSAGTDGMICPKSVIEKQGIDYFATHSIGTGPYKLKEFKSGVHVLLEAMPGEHFSLGKPKYQYVKFSIIPEEAARIGLLKRGEVDIAVLSRERLKEVTAMGLRTAKDPAMGILTLQFSSNWNPEYPVHDIRVRKAISLAIDADAMMKHIWGGLGRTTGNYVATPMTLGYKETPTYPYDPEKARQLLAEAGYPNGFDINVHVYPRPGMPEQIESMEAIVDYLAKVGIRGRTIMYPDYGTFRPLRMNGNKGLKGGILFGYAGARFYPFSSYAWTYSSKGAGSGIREPEIDELLDRAFTTLDRRKAADLVYEIEQCVLKHLPGIGMFEPAGLFGVGDRIPTDWDGSPLGNDWNLEAIVMYK